MMTDRIDLTAEQARELNDTGRVELWTEIDPQLPEGCTFAWFNIIQSFGGPKTLSASFKNNKGILAFIAPSPHGPDGGRWVATTKCNACSGYGLVGMGECCPKCKGVGFFSRANANITTTVEQRDGVWGFVTVVERTVEG